MRITLLPRGEQVELEGPLPVREVIERLGLVPGTVMVIRGDELVLEQDILEADDDVEIRSVISGG